jgi:hypothetical protein
MIAPIHDPGFFKLMLMGFPMIAPVVGAAIVGGIASIISALLKGSGTQPTVQTTKSDPTRYESPNVGFMDNAISNLLLQNANATANWGRPAGMQGINTSLLQNTAGLIGKEGDSLIDLYNKKGLQTPAQKLKAKTDCYNGCVQLGGGITKIMDCTKKCTEKVG